VIEQSHDETLATVERLIALHIGLATELDRHDASGIHERVKRSDGEAHPAPANLTVVESRILIDQFAWQHAKMLIDAGTWTPSPNAGTIALLVGISQRLGHWTNDPLTARDFARKIDSLTKQAEAALSPQPTQWRHIGVGCYVDGCKGRYKVKLPEMNDDMTDAERKRAFRDSAPEAVCWVELQNGRELMIAEHTTLAALAARDVA